MIQQCFGVQAMRARVRLLVCVPVLASFLAAVSGCTGGGISDTTAPAAVSDLAVVSHATAPGVVVMSWTAVADDGAAGTPAFSYEIRRHEQPIDAQSWDSAVVCPQAWVPADAGYRETHEMGGLTQGAVYYFALRVSDEAGNVSGISNSGGAAAYSAPDLIPPDCITDLAAQPGTAAGSVILTWTAVGDDGDFGTAEAFDVRYSEAPITDFNFASAAIFPQSWEPLPGGQIENRLITGLTCCKTYYFAILVRDEIPNASVVSNSPSGSAGAGTWTQAYADPQAAAFNGIWGFAGNDVFAVGYGGVIVHFDGAAWTSMASGTANTLKCVWGAAPDDVYAGGEGGTILHYDGTAWTAMTTGVTGTISSISGSSPCDIYAVGWDGANLHYDGQSWSSFAGEHYLSSAWCGPDGVLVAAGGICSCHIHISKVMRGNASGWAQEPSVPSCGLYGVWGSSPNNVFAVGGACCMNRSTCNIVRFDGTQWHAVLRASATLMNVSGCSEKCAYAVGHSGTVYHYDGFSWTQIPSGTTAYLSGVWSSPDFGVYVVGGSKVIMKLQ